MRSRNLKRLVVNASVARAAGGKGATASVSINCTEFLETFRDECPHHIVMISELSVEWNAHQSNFAARWLKSIIARKRFDYITPPQDTALSDKVNATTTRERDIAALRKDFHLLIFTSYKQHSQPIRQLFHLTKPSDNFSNAPLNRSAKSEILSG